uniref:Uncharacterized protein n=1 Tax=Mus musculus TaxID=10090 RepID=Q3URL6_MOUSE|nr:unnamed protein product [Mus musculus]
MLEKEEEKEKEFFFSEQSLGDFLVLSRFIYLFLFFLTDYFPNSISPSPLPPLPPNSLPPTPHPRSKHKPQSYGLLWILEYRFLPPPSLPAPFSVLLNTSPSLELTFSPCSRWRSWKLCNYAPLQMAGPIAPFLSNVSPVKGKRLQRLQTDGRSCQL